MENHHRKSLIKYIFTSPDHDRLRAGWRILLQSVLMIALGLCAMLPITIFLIWTNAITPNMDLSVFNMETILPLQIAELVMITGSVYLARRFFDKKSFSSLGVELNSSAVRDTFAGIVIAFLIMGLIYTFEFSMGWVIFEGFSWQFEAGSQVAKSALGFAVIFILTGWNEELISRGYHLQNISEGMGRWWGIVISSAVFGIAHITNPNATWFAAFGIFIGGLFFAFSYIRSNQLWLPIGLHIGWNFSQGVIFGFPVSGLTINPLIRVQFSGPVLWSGGAFGPEAGLVLLPALLFGFVMVYFYTARRTGEFINEN